MFKKLAQLLVAEIKAEFFKLLEEELAAHVPAVVPLVTQSGDLAPAE